MSQWTFIATSRLVRVCVARGGVCGVSLSGLSGAPCAPRAPSFVLTLLVYKNSRTHTNRTTDTTQPDKTKRIRYTASQWFAISTYYSWCNERANYVTNILTKNSTGSYSYFFRFFIVENIYYFYMNNMKFFFNTVGEQIYTQNMCWKHFFLILEWMITCN